VTRWLAFYKSLIGKKVIVAVTGAVMAGFLVGHMAGNLKVFLPDPEPGVPDIDAYAEFLRSVGEPAVPHGGVLWGVRIVLLAAVLLHVVCVIQLTQRNRMARPVGYRVVHHKRVSRSARWMMRTGLLVLAFIGFHILHFSTGTIDPETFRHGAVYANLQAAFTQWPMATLYVAVMAMVTVHVFHGIWSVFQSLGLDNPDRNRLLRTIAAVIAIALFIGFSTVPVSFALGALGGPELRGAMSQETGPQPPHAILEVQP